MNNREILFRGKRLDNNEWIEGFAIFTEGKAFILFDSKIVFDKAYPENRLNFRLVEVIPSTVGQYTGLTDKKDTRIFEGDIIKTKKYGKDVGHSNVNAYDIFVVKYEPAMFRLENHNRGFALDDDGYSKYKVIGNIHDNPELIGGIRNE